MTAKTTMLTFAKQAAVYGAGAAAIQVVGVATVPVFSRTFTPAQYGVLEIGMVGFSIMLTLAEVGMASASQRSFYDYGDEDVHQRRHVLFTGIATSSLVAIGLCTVILLLREPISLWLFDTDSYSRLVALLALTIPVANFAILAREVMRLRFRAWHYAISSFVAAFAAAAYGLIAVLAFGAGIEAVVGGLLLGNAIAAVYGGLVARVDIRGRFDSVEFQRMVKFGLPLIPTGLALWGLSFLDRVMLAKLSSLDEVGQYAMANKLAALLLLVVTALMAAFGPFILQIYQEDPVREKEVRSRMLTYVTVGLALCGLVLSLFAREILTIVAPAFTRASEAVGLVTLGVVLYGIASVVMTGISYVRRTSIIAVGAIGAAAFNAALNFVLIPPLGEVGAGIATALAYGGMTLLYYVKAQQLYPTAYEPWKVVVVVAVASAIGVIGAVQIDPLALSLGLKLAGLAAFAVVLVSLGIVQRSEIARLRRVLGRAERLRAAEA